MAETATIAHPREVFAYERGEDLEASFLSALERNRLHHGWLLTGPEGAGKATFAYRAARRLLGAAPDQAYGPLGASPDDPVSRLVAARSHPDLLVVERWTDDGKPRKVIPVEEARRLPEFFSKAPGLARWRVAIVDSVDDLNVSGANALLKILEEPPQRGVLFLVSHAPGALLDTIRSRCRRLVFRPWPDEAVADFVSGRSEVSPEDALHLARMAHGAPGRALQLLAKGGLAADEAARALIRPASGCRSNRTTGAGRRFPGRRGRGTLHNPPRADERSGPRTRHRGGGGGRAGERSLGGDRDAIGRPARRDRRAEPRPWRCLLDGDRRPARGGKGLTAAMLIDSHVNLHAAQFEHDRDEVIARARAAGVRLMMTICDRIDRFESVRAIAEFECRYLVLDRRPSARIERLSYTFC